MKTATLVLLLDEDKEQVCLGMKKRGFGMGKWNGFGGKFNESIDKSIEDGAIRELEEETRGENGFSGVKVLPEDLKKVAKLDFIFENKSDWNQTVFVYTVKNWEGYPNESEEMRPQWFSFKDIPYSSMWSDDSIWLPRVLAGEKIEGVFKFDSNEMIVSYTIT